MRRPGKIAVLAGFCLFAAACSHLAKPQTHAAAAPSAPAVSAAEKPGALSTPSQNLVTDERAVAAAQRALTLLGYTTGKSDGVMGPATRRAIQAFQKDHGIAEDG